MDAQEREKILVADDEAVLRRLINRILDRAGYGVVLAADGAEAADALASEPSALRAVVLDVGMPPDGPQPILRQLRERADDVGVVLMSGATLDPDLKADLDRHHGVFLPKPFAPDALLEALGCALAAPAED